MKISVSLDDNDVEFLDRETREGVFESRSAAVAAAIRGLRERALVDSYRVAFDEWAESDDALDWSTTTRDGLV
jgi:Arc/MetJ-type ribon-helix-helix transcriptional regulator